MRSNIGINIRKHRRARDLTIEQLANLIGSQKAYVWKLENRTPKNPSREKLQAIADIFEITVAELCDHGIKEIAVEDDSHYCKKFLGLNEDAKSKVKQIIDIFA